MNLKGEKYVRFEDSNSDRSSGLGSNQSRRLIPFIRRPSLSSIMWGIRRGVDMGASRIKSLWNWSFHGHSKSTTYEHEKPRNKILDPQEPFLQIWNKIFVLSCIIAVSLDPLFFYIPVVDGKKHCMSIDETLEITTCVLRSFIDLFYVLHIIFQFRTGFIAPSSRVFGRGELIEDPKAIAKRYLSSYFIIDVLSILPLPQAVVVLVIPLVNSPTSLVTKVVLRYVIFAQYIPRVWRIFPLYEEVTRTSGIFAETAWAGAAFNLLLYMLASHTIGAIWYMIAIERKDYCWRKACRGHSGCNLNDLYCGGHIHGDTSFLNSSCLQVDPPNGFDFGIFLDALQSHVAEHMDFPKKTLYCFWWGLRNLSSLGQNLETSTFAGEIMFAVFISVIGLVLFSLLIGNMQKYLQSITVRVEEMRIKRQDADQWMSHRMLPEDLKVRIRKYGQYKWQETRGVEEYSLVRNLPKDLRRDIKRHLCWTLLTKVPMFKRMDKQLLDAICNYLSPILYTKDSYIVREGDPVDEMLFIMRGNIFTMTTNGGQTGFFNSTNLVPGEFCGEELLTWALDPNSSSTLPISTRTVLAIKDVEAFCLMPEDLRNVASQFRRLFHSKELQHIFRSSSLQWRTWGACFIQEAWRRHTQRNKEKLLQEKEYKLKDSLSEGVNTTSLGATIYASKFATHMLGNLKRNRPHNNTKTTTRFPPLLPQKPTEPDFNAQNRS